MTGLLVDKAKIEDIFVPPYPEGYNDVVWVVFRDGKPFRVYHNKELALREMDRLEAVYASLSDDDIGPDGQKLTSSGSTSTPP
jgi:hypothetical protein